MKTNNYIRFCYSNPDNKSDEILLSSHSKNLVIAVNKALSNGFNINNGTRLYHEDVLYEIEEINFCDDEVMIWVKATL